MKPIIVAASLIVSMCRPVVAIAQSEAGDGDHWRQVSHHLAIGSRVDVRTTTDLFRATLMAVHDDGIVVLPRGRVPEPPRLVLFQEITRLVPVNVNGGTLRQAAGTGAGIGVAAGVAWLVLLFHR